MLQLISDDVDIKLLKQKDYIRYNKESFKEEYGIDPIRVIDLKSLMGDASDNIPGVKGIGEKTALKVLQQYESLDGIYEHLDEIKGSVHDKLENDKENAYKSYDLATIVRNVPMEITLDDISYKKCDHATLNTLYEDLEFYSFLKRDLPEEEVPKKKIEYVIVKSASDIHIDSSVSVYLENLGLNYHTATVLGMGVYNEKVSYYIPPSLIKECLPKILPFITCTYDLKKLIVSLHWMGISTDINCFDTMIAAYLLDYNVKDDIAYLANSLNYDIPFYEKLYGKNTFEVPEETIMMQSIIMKAQFLYETKSLFEDKIKSEGMESLFNDIELPLASVLATMEVDGVLVDKDALDSMGEEFKIKIELVEKEIYNYAGCEFNISSPKQLGEILFDKLGLSHGKKNRSGYSTSADILNKIRKDHPIVDKILEYRTLTKLYTTYIEGLKNFILSDGKIHTIYTQTLTRTGRLSSIEPNLQNIPILGGDYSQIELRILAGMANIESLISAFKEGIDIHTKTASDIFNVPMEAVTSNMRRIAKAVNFGIIYGISSFGLAENLEIGNREAKQFIDTYKETYPGIDRYMNSVVEKAYQDGYVTTLMNRKRYIPELQNKNHIIRSSGERIALNTPIQGTSADIIKKAMVDIARRFKEENLKSKMIIQVHDELVFDTLLYEKEKVIAIVKDCMENVCDLTVPFNVEISYGYNWYEAK